MNSPSSTTQDPLEVLKGMYAAEVRYLSAGGPGKASFSTLAPYFAVDVVLHQAEGLPYGGTWRGHVGMERFFVAMSRTWDMFDLVEQQILSTRTPIAVWTKVRARSRATGKTIELPIMQRISIENGLITEVDPFYWDTAAVAAVCH